MTVVKRSLISLNAERLFWVDIDFRYGCLEAFRFVTQQLTLAMSLHSETVLFHRTRNSLPEWF